MAGKTGSPHQTQRSAGRRLRPLDGRSSSGHEAAGQGTRVNGMSTGFEPTAGRSQAQRSAPFATTPPTGRRQTRRYRARLARIAHYPTGENQMTTASTNLATDLEADTGLVGWLAKNPELHLSASGVPYLRCRLSVRRYVPKNEPKPEPVYYDLTAFGSLAENVARDLHEADRVVVSGRVERSTWIGRDGHERSSLGIVANAIGLDLRFARSPDTTTTTTKPPGIITELVGPAPATDYTNEPF